MKEMGGINSARLLFDTMPAWRGAMVKLVPMEQADFEAYLEEDIQRYAQAHIKAGNWEPSEALERSRKEHDQLLPDGLASKNQYLFTILDEDTGTKVGVLFVNIEGSRAFIYDFIIDGALRGKGYGKQGLVALDEKLKSMNVESVALHVFGDNITAQELYKKTGYQITGIHMKKVLK
jgi:ribosomal protein S18 acetylase RimI-like enzyme